MSQVDRHGHQGGGFVAGKAEHHTLVTRADLIQFGLIAFFGLQRFANTHIDIRALAGNGG